MYNQITKKQIEQKTKKLKQKNKWRTKMAIRMGVPKDSIKAPEPVDEDLYTLRIDGFKPGFTRDKSSINFNPLLRIVSGDKTGTKNAGKQLYESLNQQAGWLQRDMTHAAGLDMIKVDGTDDISIPGVWNGDPQKPETLRYEGPLVGKTFKAYVVKVQGNNNKFYNKVKYYMCTLPDCNKLYPEAPHSMDLT
jgi:hypothetical protein